ncbi:MAG: hypothetical protein R3C16_07015 [Hyphomonadaceae bacterium]
MQSNSTIVACTCGVRYERSERRLPIKDIGAFECDICGQRMEIWSGRVVPLFKRIEETLEERKRA